MGECGLGFSTDTGKSRMTRHTPLYLLALTLCLVVLFIDTASAEFFEDGDGDLVDGTLATNKRAWNSNFNGGTGKRSWNNRFTGNPVQTWKGPRHPNIQAYIQRRFFHL